MKIVLVIACIWSLIWFIYNIICYKKKKINYMVKANEFTAKDDKYYKMQLIFGIANSVLMILVVLVTIKKDYHIQLIVFFLTNAVVNFILRYVAIIIKYASFEEN